MRCCRHAKSLRISVDRKRGKKSWAIIIDIRRDPKTGRRRQKWHSVQGTKRDAEAELIRLLHQLQTDTYVEPKRVAVEDHLRSWQQHIAQRVRPKTAERYESIIDHNLIPALGHHQLSALRPHHIAEAWASALADGRRDGTGGLKPRTVEMMHRVLFSALKQAVRWGLLARNPAEAVDPPRPDYRELQVLTPDEASQLLDAVARSKLYIPVLLAVTTGMRRGEILALRWKDIDLEQATLQVCRSLGQTKSGLYFAAPKTTRGRRSISLPAIAVEALRRHKIRQAERYLANGVGNKGPEGLVVCRWDGEPLRPGSLSHHFQYVIQRAGLPRITFHALRHSHITHLLAMNVHPKVAADRAGHSSVKVTLDTYSHAVPSLEREVADRVDQLFRKNKER